MDGTAAGLEAGTALGSPAEANSRPNLGLAFEADPEGETYLSHQRAAYPFHICRALKVRNDPPGMTTVYLQSSSGGLYADEGLAIKISAGPQAAAHVTSQASTIVHGAREGTTRVATDLRVGAGGLLEFLPDPLILFPRARLQADLRLRVAPGGRAILADSFLHHDPAGADSRFEVFTNDMVIENEQGDILARDRFRALGDSLEKAARPGKPPMRAHGSMVMVCDRERALAAVPSLRRELDGLPEEESYWGVSTLPGEAGVWLRVLAADGAALRRVMTRSWLTLRKELTGVVPQIRKK